MFNTRNMGICAVLAAMNLSQAFNPSQAVADLFDFGASKRKAEAAAGKSSRYQKVAATRQAKGSAGTISLAAYADDGMPGHSVPTLPPVSTPEYSSGPVSASPTTTNSFGVADNSCECFNCGQDDHCQSHTRNCRKHCKQTWYPRVAPYCQSGWGWNQPCWRRTADTYNCPRPQQVTAPRRRTAAPEGTPEEQPAGDPSDDGIPEASPDQPLSESPLPPRESAARR